MYMAGRLRTASMPPSTLIESAVYSPSDLAVPFFPFFWANFSFGTSMGLLFSGTAAAADSGSFGAILLHSNGDTSRCVSVATHALHLRVRLPSLATLMYYKSQQLKGSGVHIDYSTEFPPFAITLIGSNLPFFSSLQGAIRKFGGRCPQSGFA